MSFVNPIFTIAHVEDFPFELGRAPRKIQNAWKRTIIPTLTMAPDVADPPRIKHLDGFRDLWRMRVGDDYRLVYRVDRAKHEVILIVLRHRKEVYDELEKLAKPKPDVRVGPPAGEVIKKVPEASPRDPEHPSPINPEPGVAQPEPKPPDLPLPMRLTAVLLESWGVPSKYHRQLAPVRTESELLSVEPPLPDEVLERVLNGLWPRPIADLLQQPIRVAAQPDDLEAAARGELSLDSFLLKLDDEQKAYISRFEGGRARGPWLLKGGPGSGKSTVALYCIQAIARAHAESLHLEKRPLRILFTTFTNSLVHASDYLLKTLRAYGERVQIDVRTVDSLAGTNVPAAWQRRNVTTKSQEMLSRALLQCRRKDPDFAFAQADLPFLLREIEWVIVGQGLSSVDEYVDADRSGRGRALNSRQRRWIWQLFEAFQTILHASNLCLFSEKLREAARHVRPVYDYVFIDEAQDLKPVAIRFCIGLCRDPAHVFLTADTNQTIYGHGMSWSRVAAELRFSGRARILRRNYRTTVELWEAIRPLAPNSADADRETLEIEPVFHGPRPILLRYAAQAELAARLNSFLRDSCLQERVGPGNAAVLCATHKDMSAVGKLIDPALRPRVMQSRTLDLAHPGVKLVTMHSAKGLEFPIVAVIAADGAKSNEARNADADDAEEAERAARLFFVACSRAMKRLIVLAGRSANLPWLDCIDGKHWQIEAD